METKFIPFEIKALEDGKIAKVIINGIEYGPIPQPEIKKPEWDDFGRVNGYYLNACSEVGALTKANSSDDSNRNTWPTKEEAEAALALSQLLQWRNKYNEGWQRANKEVAWAVYRDCNDIVCVEIDGWSALVFKNKETAKRFLNDFRELLEIAKPLL